MGFPRLLQGNNCVIDAIINAWVIKVQFQLLQNPLFVKFANAVLCLGYTSGTDRKDDDDTKTFTSVEEALLLCFVSCGINTLASSLHLSLLCQSHTVIFPLEGSQNIKLSMDSCVIPTVHKEVPIDLICSCCLLCVTFCCPLFGLEQYWLLAKVCACVRAHE